MKYRRKLSYLLTPSRHAGRVGYYLKGLARDLTPSALAMRHTQRLLAASLGRPDAADIDQRLHYYNKLDDPFDASTAPRVDAVDRGSSRYYLDLIEHAKGFGPDRRLDYLFGDITHVPPRPTVLKSRPIHGDNRNSVLLSLNKYRHFTWSADPIPFRDKKNAAVWRGTLRTPARRTLVETFHDHPVFDIGHVHHDEGGLPEKASLSHDDQKRFKFFLSVEGNEVATNLKWGMASNMLVMSPALRYETWFMEGLLEPGTHFVLLKDDFSDLEEKVDYYTAHPEAAEQIISNAHDWINRFADPVKERIISALVLRKYFALSGQM